MKNVLISIVGPTAAGKTDFAIDLAQRFGTEIISADSRQCYKEMNIGTAKPTADDLKKVEHHFINSHSIHEFVTAGDFENLALEKIAKLHERLNPVIMVGGSGLYVDAVVHGLASIPKIDKEVRLELIQRLNQVGIAKLFGNLQKVDLEYAKSVDKSNPQRIIRALEVYEGTGKPYSYWRGVAGQERNFHVISIGLEQDRESLYNKIDSRMDRMISSGLFDEARSLFQYRHLNALQTVGYKEIFDHMLGKYDYDECVRLLKRNSRRYAKRQLTWFNKNDKTIWFDSNSREKVVGFLQEELKI